MMKIGVLPYGVVARERRPGVTILGYHRVGGRSRGELDVPTELFEWQMAYIRRHFRVLSMDEIASLGSGSGTGERRGAAAGDAVAITFDDGYEDVYSHAFPVLRRLSLPATIYLATSCVEDRRPFPAEGPLPEHRRCLPLTWEQAREMVGSGLIAIGAHTHTHPDMSTATLEAAEREIAESNALIARRLGAAPLHFAYPWGRVSPAAAAAVRRAYRTAAVGGTRKNAYAEIDPMRLRRVPVQRSDGRLFFRLKLGSYLLGEDWLRSGPRTRRARSGAPADTVTTP